ncbi:hypothetical protein HNP24_001114 [Chryseobacterium sediminis]|uniref:Uncharacterized protein n=1 Tax=Chryseobacterium sediminis TaxID=1679494 RepID=A0ABR6PWR5_9FLAO|nr:hypothetical protein [Chryseobacterium sediminis]
MKLIAMINVFNMIFYIFFAKKKLPRKGQFFSHRLILKVINF